MNMKQMILTLCLLVGLSVSVLAQKADELQGSYNYKRGVELATAETPDLQQAMEFLRKEVGEHPKNGYAYFYMAAIHDNQDQEGDALGAVNKAIGYLGKDKEWLAHAYRLRASINRQLGHDSQAIADWEQAYRNAPDDMSALIDRAQYYYEKDRYDMADADYDRVIKAQPGEVAGYLGKARSAVDQKQYDKAVELTNYCLKLDPKSSRSLSFRAEAYKGLKRYNEAADDVIQALAIDADDKAFYLIQDFRDEGRDVLLAKLRIQAAKSKNEAVWPYYQGIVQESNKRYLRAARLYLQANDLEADAATLYRVAYCYQEAGHNSLALDYIDRAIAMDSTDTDLMMLKAGILYNLDRSREALDIYTALIDKEPDNAGYYASRGYMRKLTHDTDGAIEDFSTALVIAPDNIHAYYSRGELYREKGDMAKANADYDKVVEKDTTYNGSTVVMYVYQVRGENAKAIAVVDSVLAREEADAGDFYNAACVYARMGDRQKAMSYLTQAMEKGYLNMVHIRRDTDMDNLRQTPEFGALMERYEQKLKAEEQEQESELGTGDTAEYVSEVPFTRESGVCNVKCSINGLPLHFVFDTGASTISMSMVEATFMMKNGYLSKNDVVGSAQYSDAQGNVSEGTVINLRKVTFGDRELTNVRASVVRNQAAPLLLGQSVLSRLGSVEMDNARNVIRIKYRK